MAKAKVTAIVTPGDVANVCVRRRIAFVDEDLVAACRYLNGRRICAEYDRLCDWVQMIVNAYEKEPTALKLRRDLRPGDVVLDCTGKDLYTVTAAPQAARARGYVVVQVRPAPGREAQFPSRQTSGYGADEVTVKKEA